ncbi:hypothetical protein CS022_11950 [Veronia nyctiphanis]|uniref:HEAT repeat domain-containing protein n=1 Tax=Veronia nyctiphanis TaxID=1278244 RepID=A0A4Q0YV59_9GAMM|nr:hypothetical protein [Veronia nyctiphanis]RXJ73009.1 hypothetical protein CS022_11950 [Veronia nyctiphanis]
MRMKYLQVALLLATMWVSPYVTATTLNVDAVNAELASYHYKTATQNAASLFHANNFKQLDLYLAELPLLTQEAVFDFLCRQTTDLSTMTPERETFLVKLSHLQPTYLVKESIGTYWVTKPVFNYSGSARWILNRWQIKLLADEAATQLLYDNLILSKWMSFGGKDYTLRRAAIVSLIENQSIEKVQVLKALFIDDEGMMWSPDNAVLAALAVRLQDAKLMHQLWSSKSDNYSLEALEQFDKPELSEFAAQMLIDATANSTLRSHALEILAGVNPMPDIVRNYLAKELSRRWKGEEIAKLMIEEGNVALLDDIAAKANAIAQRNVVKAKSLSQ